VKAIHHVVYAACFAFENLDRQRVWLLLLLLSSFILPVLLFCTLLVQQEEPKAARLVQEYTNSIVGNASLLLVRFSSPKLAFCKSSEFTFL